MFRNYIKTALRSLLKGRLYSFVNLFGLSLGIAGALYCFSYVSFHQSFDSDFADSNRTYRITTEWFQEGEFLEHRAAAVPALYQVLDESFANIQKYARYHKGAINVVRTYDEVQNELRFEENNIFYADSSFLDIFDLEFVFGDPKTALNAPNKIVLSESTARKYFKGENPLGKVMYFNGEFEFNCLVSGVIKDLPEKSHLDGEMIISLSTKTKLVPVFNIPDNWIWRSFYTYTVFDSPIDIVEAEQKLNRAINEKIGTYYADRGYEVNFHIQPLKSIHTGSQLFEEMKANVSKESLLYVKLIGLLLVLIAVFNYINLTTARNLKRAKEIGVRKVVGAQRKQLIFQFLTESLLLNGLSLLAAILILSLVHRLLNIYLGIESDLSFLNKPTTVLILAVTYVVIGVLSGLYPAWVLSGFKPVSVLKGNFSNSKSGLQLRKVLVTIQISISLGLVICLFVVNRQVEYSRNRPLGIDRENIVVINGPKVKDENYVRQLELFKSKVESNGLMGVMSTVSSLPGEVTSAGRDFRNEQGVSKFLRIMRVEYDFEDVFGLAVLHGVPYSSTRPSDDIGLVVNESAVKLMGYSNAADILGKTLTWSNRRDRINSKVIGVLEDYNPSAQSDPVPTAFVLNRSYSAPWDSEYYVGRINESSMKGISSIISKVENEWNQIFAQDPFNYYFVDDFFEQQFDVQKQFGNILVSFSLLAFVIAIMGLLALSAFINQMKMKEIGIRKVLGSSRQSATLLLLRQYFVICGVSVIISVLFTYSIMRDWLNSFPYRIELDIYLFAIPVLVLVGIILMVISIQIFQASAISPVKVLKNE